MSRFWKSQKVFWLVGAGLLVGAILQSSRAANEYTGAVCDTENTNCGECYTAAVGSGDGKFVECKTFKGNPKQLNHARCLPTDNSEDECNLETLEPSESCTGSYWNCSTVPAGATCDYSADDPDCACSGQDDDFRTLNMSTKCVP